MFKCKHCVHYELCKYNAYQEAHYFGKDKEIYISINNNSACKFFKSAADVVEVVRCIDCKYSSFIKSCSKYECKKGCGALKYCNDFCSYGERKTD